MTSIAKNICLCLLFEVIRQDLSNIFPMAGHHNVHQLFLSFHIACFL